MSGSQGNKEKQVNALTNLLVQSMDGSPDEDILGVCEKCKEYVINEGSGCVAMEKVYHITCFTCHQCKIQLQGKPFFALEGKPYCEQDYLVSQQQKRGFVLFLLFSIHDFFPFRIL